MKFEEKDFTPWVCELLALCLIHAPAERDIDEALLYAERAVKDTERRSPALLATLATVQSARGEHAEAVFTIQPCHDNQWAVDHAI